MRVRAGVCVQACACSCVYMFGRLICACVCGWVCMCVCVCGWVCMCVCVHFSVCTTNYMHLFAIVLQAKLRQVPQMIRDLSDDQAIHDCLGWPH